MSGTPRGVGAPVARRDEHGARRAESERSEDFRSIELLSRLRRLNKGLGREQLATRRLIHEASSVFGQ